jgi:hypothetical protein
MKLLQSSMLEILGGCIIECADLLYDEECDDKMGDYGVYWTSDGLLLLNQDKSIRSGFFLSHDTNHFVIDINGLRIGAVPAPRNNGWVLSYVSMLGALAKRVIMDKSEVPKCSRLVKMAEEPLHMITGKVETKWVTSLNAME